MKRLTFLLFCLLLGIGMANAQTTKVTGTVISAEDNEPIIGASIDPRRFFTLQNCPKTVLR